MITEEKQVEQIFHEALFVTGLDLSLSQEKKDQYLKDLLDITKQKGILMPLSLENEEIKEALQMLIESVNKFVLSNCITEETIKTEETHKIHELVPLISTRPIYGSMKTALMILREIDLDDVFKKIEEK